MHTPFAHPARWSLWTATLAISLCSALIVACDDAPASELEPPADRSGAVITLGGDPVDPATLPNGLTFIALPTEHGSLAGAYRGKDRVIFFEARTGPCKPVDGVVPDVCDAPGPDGEPREVDSRFLDGHGLAFAGRIGGHDFDDETWNDAVWNVDPALIDARARRVDFELAVLAASAVVESPIGRRFPREARALERLGRSIRDDVVRPGGEEHSVDTADVLTAEADPSSAASYYHKISMYKGACCGVAEHSSVVAWVLDPAWIPLQYWMYGNHGRHHNESGMSYFCSYNSGLRSNYTLRINGYGDCGHGDTCGGGCGTSYGLWSGKHVCNDDSHAQVGNVKANAYLKWSVCSDLSLNGYADQCSGI